MDAAKEQKPSFLEGVLDVINDFPVDLRDTLTKIRELDLEVENGMDEQKKRIDKFFQNAEKLGAEERKKLFESIEEAFEIIIEDTDEKIKLANALHKGLKAYLGQINEKLSKFKEDLECADPGITDIIERKVFAEISPTQNYAPPYQRINAKKKVAKKKK